MKLTVESLRKQAEILSRKLTDDEMAYVKSLIQTAYFLGERDGFKKLMKNFKREKKDQLANATDLL